MEEYGFAMWTSGMYLRSIVREFGLAATRGFMKEKLGRNLYRDWKRFEPFLNLPTQTIGIDPPKGVLPGRAPVGYKNNKAERTIEPDPNDSNTVKRIFELYATGAHTLTTIRKKIRIETEKQISRNNLHKILTNRFYIGTFLWRKELN